MVALDNELIYRVLYIPGYYSRRDYYTVTFYLKEPNLVLITLGYPPNNQSFFGEDLRNEPKLIERLEKDEKFVEIEE